MFVSANDKKQDFTCMDSRKAYCSHVIKEKKGVEDRFLGLKPTIFWANQTSAFSNFNSFFYIFLKLTLIHLLLLLFFEKSLSTFIASISKNKYFEKKIDLSNLSSKISNQHVKCLLIDSQIFIFLSLIIINY